MRFSKSLRGTIIFFISIAAILPIIVFGLVTAGISTGILKNLIQNKNALLTKVLISRVEEYLNHPYEDLKSITFYFEGNSLNSPKADVFLEKVIENHQLYLRLQIADENGIVTHVTPFDEEVFNIDVSSRRYFKKTKETGQVYWSEAFISSQFNQPVVSVSIPLDKGVVTAYISLQSLTESIKDLDIGKGSFVAITDQTATYIAHFDYTKVQGRHFDPHYDRFRKAYRDDVVTQEVVHDGVEMICHVSFIKSTDWAVSIYQSKQEALAPIVRLSRFLAVGAVGILILAVLFSLRFSRSINRAISKIMAYTGGVSAGNYAMTLDNLDYSEFSKLGYYFKKMATSIKIREERIKESEKTFRAIFNSNAIGGSITDSDGNFIQFNNKWLDFTGYESGELNRMIYYNLVYLEDRDDVKQRHKDMLLSISEISRIEARLVTKFGKIIWIEQHSSVVREEGKKPYFINIAVDITGRKNADLERSRLASVIEQTNEHILITNVSGEIEYVNPAFERITGYSREEVIGKNPRIMKSGFQDSAFYKDMWRTISSGQIWTGRMTNLNKSGDVFDEYATIFPVINSEGEISNYVGIKRDITEQLRMEDQLRQSQKMEAIGTLAGGIAHDFNNIISALSGYARLARDRLDNQVKTRHYLDQIDKATHRAGELVGQILTFSRKSEQKKTPMLLYPIVKEAMKFIRSSIPSTVKIDQNIVEKGYVLADPTQVYQIVMNLCTNAYQAMQESGGVLTVSLSEVELSSPDVIPGWHVNPGEYLKFSVKDTGKGFPEEIKSKIFEPYFTTKSKGEGTGLGLAMVHGIISSYEGCIEAVSKQGQGAEFNVYLPVCDIKKDSKPKEIIPQEVIGGDEHVLVVDDEEQLVNIIDDTLTHYGYRVTGFIDSQKAYDEVARNPKQFDIMITDLIMPAITGIELIERVRALHPHIPAVLCSGHTMTMNSKKASYKGINAYLEKPFPLEKLAQTIRSVLDEKKSAS